MPKPKTTRPERELIPAELATLRLLEAMQELDGLDRFRLAAVVTWMRTVWCGKPEVLAATQDALDCIAALTAKEARESIASAADSNLRAAVTS